MSGQWEMVGRKKERNSKLPVPTNAEFGKNKTGVAKAPPVKIEDIFSKDQMKSLYTITKNKEDVKKTQEKPQKVVNVAKKTSQVQRKSDKSQEIKIPKSIDSALSNIDANELRSTFEDCQTSFPDQPTLWMKEIVNYLNRKIPLEISDPVFASKPVGFPWIVIPTVIKSVIELTIKEIGCDNAALFFNISVNTMIDDMAKQHTVIGSKIFLQCMAINDPKLTLEYLHQYNNKLKSSYQNHTTIGQSICWVFAQTGINDFNIGLEVFQTMFKDLLLLKNYTRFVTRYLIDLINRHSTKSISITDYGLLVDLICSSKKNFPTDLTKDLFNLINKLNNMLFHDKVCISELIEPLLNRVQNNKQSEYICEAIVIALSKDLESFNVWSKLYSSNITSSAIVLNYLVDHRKRNKSIISTQKMSDTLRKFTKINEELVGNKKMDEGITKSAHAIKMLKEKMVVKKKSSCSCRCIPLLLFISASIWIYYDVSKHGSWDASCTSKALNRTGVYDYTNQALDHAHQGCQWMQDRIEQKFPGFSANVKDFSEPYVNLFGQLCKVGCNLVGNMRDYIVSKGPVIRDTIEYYAPDAIETITHFAYATWDTFADTNYKGYCYLRDDVFVGSLSPENMKNVALEFLSSIYKIASECSKWVVEKIEAATN